MSKVGESIIRGAKEAIAVAPYAAKIAELEKKLAAARAENEQLRKRVEELEEKWQKHSRLRIMWRDAHDAVHRQYLAAIEAEKDCQ